MSVGAAPVPHGTHLASGAPCWIDLAAPDVATAEAFYHGLFGWHWQRDPGGYLLALSHDEPIAGIYPPTQPDLPTGWTLYLAVADSERTAELIPRLGGRVLLPPQQMPGQGSLLLGADPGGGVIGFWQTTASWRFGTHRFGTYSWAELNTWDGAAADAFFADLFPYRQEQAGDGTDIDYTTWALDIEPILGRLRMGAEYPPDTRSHWMIYFEVGPHLGTDDAAHRAERLGGRVRVEPFDSPSGRVAVVEDPGGAVFTVIDTTVRVPLDDAEDEHRAEVDDPYDD